MFWDIDKYKLDLFKFIYIGAKLAVAPVARATPLFLPRPEIIYKLLKTSEPIHVHQVLLWQ